MNAIISVHIIYMLY